MKIIENNLNKMQDRQDYNYYESSQMKDDMNQNSKQNKKAYYNSKYKEQMHKTNPGNMMDDKSSMNSMGSTDYQNYPQFKKNQNKKNNYNNYNNKNQNEDFDNKNFKKMKKKTHREANNEYQYTNPNSNPIENSQGYDQSNNPQHQKNMYNNNKGYNKNKNPTFNTPNNPQGNNTITPPSQNNQMNMPYGYNNDNRVPQNNQSQTMNQSGGNSMQGFQGMSYQVNQPNTGNKSMMPKGPNMLIHNTPNQNLMYMQQQMDNENDGTINSNSNLKEEKSSETTSEDNVTQAQSIQSQLPQQNPSMTMQSNPMLDNSQSQSDTMSTNSNRHNTMTANPNPNQYMQNEMYLPKSFIQQQQYAHMPINMYNMQMMMEHPNPQMFNQPVPGMPMPNFPFGINEEGMKIHNKKIGKKMPTNKSPNETPNGMVNMNPNMMNYPMGNQPNKGFYKGMNNQSMTGGSLNSKGSLSMQGNKNTMPSFNNGVNLNFMMQGNPSPQGQRNNIPNMLNNNPNMNMGMPMPMNNLGMNMNMNPQRQFYNPGSMNMNNPQSGDQPQGNMNKRHNQNPYRTVNSDKNIIGNGMKPKENFYQQNPQLNQKNNYKNQHFNQGQNTNNNPNQRMMHQSNREEWNNYQNMMNPNQTIQPKPMMYGNMMEQQQNNSMVSLYVRIKVAKDKEELIEIKYGEDPIVVQKTLSANPNVNVNEKLITVIYHKIIRAINIRNNILNSKLSQYDLKKLIQLKHLLTKEKGKENSNELERSNSFDNLKEKYNKYVNEIKPMYEDVKRVELLNISQYN